MPGGRNVGKRGERGGDGGNEEEPEQSAQRRRKEWPHRPKICRQRADQAIRGPVHLNLRDPPSGAMP
jgi:hypothetical protein